MGIPLVVSNVTTLLAYVSVPAVQMSAFALTLELTRVPGPQCCPGSSLPF